MRDGTRLQHGGSQKVSARCKNVLPGVRFLPESAAFQKNAFNYYLNYFVISSYSICEDFNEQTMCGHVFCWRVATRKILGPMFSLAAEIKCRFYNEKTMRAVDAMFVIYSVIGYVIQTGDPHSL